MIEPQNSKRQRSETILGYHSKDYKDDNKHHSVPTPHLLTVLDAYSIVIYTGNSAVTGISPLVTV
jgi:hypothetical protein